MSAILMRLRVYSWWWLCCPTVVKAPSLLCFGGNSLRVWVTVCTGGVCLLWGLQMVFTVVNFFFFFAQTDCYYFLCPFITSSHSFSWSQGQSHADPHVPCPQVACSLRMCLRNGSKLNPLFEFWILRFPKTDVCVAAGWRCKRYGHRTGDRECPFFIKGNQKLEQFRVVSVWRWP